MSNIGKESIENVGVWIIAVMAVATIAGLTVMNSGKSATMTYGLMDLICKVTGVAQGTSFNQYKLLRRIAHSVEFFVLGIIMAVAFYRTSGQGYGIKAIASCAVISFMDQCLKTRVPGREFDVRDLPFDFVGYVVGTVIVMVVVGIRNSVSG